MTGVDKLAHALRAMIRCLSVAGCPAATAMSAADVRSNAHGLSYAILASLWQRRQCSPAWPEIYAEWKRKLPEPCTIDAALYGMFEPADRFELLTDNADAFTTRARAFEQARRSIDIATYY